VVIGCFKVLREYMLRRGSWRFIKENKDMKQEMNEKSWTCISPMPLVVLGEEVQRIVLQG